MEKFTFDLFLIKRVPLFREAHASEAKYGQFIVGSVIHYVSPWK